MTVRKNSTPIPELSGPIPIVYDIEGDRIYVGQPGERHADIKGKFNPGGIVEGVYDPKGNLQIRTDTDMPWTVYHLTRLWYSMYPELEIKGIFRLVGEERYKLASSNIAARCIKTFACDPLWEPAQELLKLGNVYIAGDTVRDVIENRPMVPGDFRIAVQGVDPEEAREIITQHCGAGALVRVDMMGFETAERHLASIESSRIMVSLSTGELIDPYHEIEQVIADVPRSHDTAWAEMHELQEALGQRTAGMTRSQRLRNIEELERLGRIAPDGSSTVHAWPDGWTIRKLHTYGDREREGWLAHHCWSEHSPSLEREDPLIMDWGNIPEDEENYRAEPHYSLRDPDNYPRASFHATPMADRSQYVTQPFGHGDNDLHPKYVQRIEEWAKRPIDVGDANGAVERDHIHDDEDWVGVDGYESTGYGWRRANILDPVQDQLSAHIYEDPSASAPDVKQDVIDFARKTIVDAMVAEGWPDPEEHGYLNLVLTGSLTTYQYDDEGGSDFDVSLFIDAERMPDWVRADLVRVMIHNVDGVLLPGTKIPLQAYVVPAEITKAQLYKEGHRSGYDLDKREWIVPPDKSMAREVRPSLKAYGKMVADKMKLLLMYSPEAAKEYFHQVKKSRQESMRTGGNDFSDANIAYKSIANAGLFPAIERLTGEHLASVDSSRSVTGSAYFKPIVNPDAVHHTIELREFGTDKVLGKIDLHPGLDNLNPRTTMQGMKRLWSGHWIASNPEVYDYDMSHAESDPRLALVEYAKMYYPGLEIPEDVQTSGPKVVPVGWDEDDTPDQIERLVRHAGFTVESAWRDVQQKAVRLLRGGKTTVLVNRPTVVMGHVVGDHGEYNTEITRTDPNSSMIEQWNCDCPWSQYAWGRTRKWKKLEGRPCFVPGQLVTMADGTYKPIEDVEVGDWVLTQQGNAKPVTYLHRNEYDGDIVSVQRGASVIKATPNHKFYGWKMPENFRPEWNTSFGGQGFKCWDETFLFDEQEGVPAGDLMQHDWLAMPVRDWSHMDGIDLMSVVESRDPENWKEVDGVVMRDRCKRGMPRYVKPSEALMYVLGLYMAEGSISADRVVEWTLHEDEADTILAELKRCLIEIGAIESADEVKTYARGGHKGQSHRLNNASLALLLSQVVIGKGRGTDAEGKSLHPWLMGLTPTLQARFLHAWHLGDGHEPDGDSRIRIDTASKIAAWQCRDMLMRCGMVPSLQHSEQSGGPTNRTKKCNIYRLSWVPDRKRSANGVRVIEPGRVLAGKVDGLSAEPYKGVVYNIAVQDDETYVVNGVAVSNCSHVLALYWSAKSHPLDVSEMDEGYQVPRGQRVREFTDQEIFDRNKGQLPLDEQKADLGLDLDKLPRSFSPDPEPVEPAPITSLPDARQQIEQQMPAQPVGPIAQPPKNPFSPPKRRTKKGPGEGQFKLFDITAPPGGQPLPPKSPTSIPGANPPGWENPGNPTQFPGTYSHRVSSGVAFHVAPSSAREGIETEGLQPNPSGWHGEGAVFAWDSIEAARSYAHYAQDADGEDRDIWEIGIWSSDSDDGWKQDAEAWGLGHGDSALKVVPTGHARLVETVSLEEQE